MDRTGRTFLHCQATQAGGKAAEEVLLVIRRLAALLAAAALLLLATPVAFAQQAEQGEWVIVYWSAPGPNDLERLEQAELRHEVLQHLPMALVRGTSEQVRVAAAGRNLRSLRANASLELYLDHTVPTIEAERVWEELGFTGRDVVVAVLDSGINATHPDLLLGSKVIENVQVSISSETTPGAGGLLEVSEQVPDTDTLGHGSHVASIVAGGGDDGEAHYPGVARDASLVGVGGGDHLTTWWALGAMDWVLENHERLGIRVVNNSWGRRGPFDPRSPLNIATRALYASGISVVFAVGNGGPAQNSQNALSVAPWVIGVAATWTNGSLAYFSARGVRYHPLYHPTIAAPGVRVTGARDSSSFIGVVTSGQPTDRYTTLSGTSQAAAHVAGTIALMLEANPGLGPGDVKAILVYSADPMPDHDESEVGAGFLNALGAVRLATAWTQDPGL